MPFYQVAIPVTLCRQIDGYFSAAKVVKVKDNAKQIRKFFVFKVLGACHIRPTMAKWSIIRHHLSLFFPNFA